MSKRVALAQSADPGSDTECDCDNCQEFWEKIHNKVIKYDELGKCLHTTGDSPNQELSSQSLTTFDANRTTVPMQDITKDSITVTPQDKWAFLHRGDTVESTANTKGRPKKGKP